MKYTLTIDPNQEEKVEIIVHQRNELIDAIEKILNEQTNEVIGYNDFETVKMNIDDICCFFTDDNKIYVLYNNKKYYIKLRLYQIESLIDNNFIKINRGCIINKKEIKKFESSFGGSIKVVLKNGFSDYISRRELRNVKRSIGI